MDTKQVQEEIQRWADLERFAQDRQAEIKAKRPAYRPERPTKQVKMVTLLVSPAKPVPLHEWPGTPSEWANQRLEVQYPVDEMSSTVAELAAIKIAKADGYLWHATLSITEQGNK